MTGKITEFLESMNPREKRTMFLAVAVLIASFTFENIYNGVFIKIKKSGEKITALEKISHLPDGNRLVALGKRLADISSELDDMSHRENTVETSPAEADYVGNILKTLQSAASDMPIRLEELASYTGGAEERADSVSAGELYISAKIRLKYRAKFRSALNYLAMLPQLPYAISVNSIEMKVSGSQRPGSDPDITTSINMDIYSG